MIFFMMDINSRAYCKTSHDDRMWNFDPEMIRNLSHCHCQSPEILFWFPENVSWFLDNVSWFPEIVFGFPQNVSWFPKIVLRFPENVTLFPKNVSRFPEYVFPVPESGTRYSYSYCNLHDEKVLGIL